MIRFYKYLLYRLYTWRLAKRDDTPIATVIFLMTAVHCIQILTFYAIILKIFSNLKFYDINKVLGIVIFFILSLVYYLIVYNKNRWEGYVREFENESDEEKRRGTIKVMTFTWGSILLFFIIVPLLFISDKLR